MKILYCKVIPFFCLQAESEKEEDIQSAFLNWLHAQSHQPLTCLTGRTNVILLPCAEGVRKNHKNVLYVFNHFIIITDYSVFFSSQEKKSLS